MVKTMRMVEMSPLMTTYTGDGDGEVKVLDHTKTSRTFPRPFLSTHMSVQMAAGAAIAAMAGAAIYMQFAAPSDASAPDPKVKGLKRTLTNGGLMPDPNNKKLVSRPSGSMAVFTEGGPALGGAESGASN